MPTSAAAAISVEAMRAAATSDPLTSTRLPGARNLFDLLAGRPFHTIAAVIHTSRSVAETERVAAAMAQMLAPGAVVALEGELGAGKTQFVRGLVKGLGGKGEQVTSPTFVLLNVYETPKMSVYHLDAYRTGGADDFQALGFLELLDQNGLVVVEWAGKVAELMPPDAIRVQLTATGPKRRRIEINGFRHRRPTTIRRAT